MAEGRTLCFDVETDGLLNELTKVHCLWIEDVDTGERWDFADQIGYKSIGGGLLLLKDAERVIAHNGIDFDFRAIEKVYPWFERPPIWDTLLVTKLLWPQEVLWDLDMAKVKRGLLPIKFAKRYSLEAWGMRTGTLKTLYDGGWDQWSPKMHEYCSHDVTANVALWRLCRKKLGWDPEHPPHDGYIWPEAVLDLEMQQQRECLEQTDIGVGFDRIAASDLAYVLASRRAELNAHFKGVFGSWWEPQDDPKRGTTPAAARKVKRVDLPSITAPRYSDKTGKRLKDYEGPPLEEYSPDAPYMRIKRVEFSATNRQHIAKQLQDLFGWEPKAYGADGWPTLDEGAVKAIPEAILPTGLKELLFESFIVNKTIGAVSEGSKSWINKVGVKGRLKTDSGRLHGGVDTIGAITGRPIYKEPNVSQTPAVQVKETKVEGRVISKEIVTGYKGGFGWECRSLFVPRDGWEMTGTDITGLELGLLGHYLAPLDDYHFANLMADPERDPHVENGKLTGLPRKETKTATYGKIYGAGPLLLGQQCGIEGEDEDELLSSSALKGYISFCRHKLGSAFKEPTREERLWIAKGSKVSKAFDDGITGFKDLKKGVKEAAEERGWIKAIDGRKITVLKPHTAFNYLLQGGGAIICKAWCQEMRFLLTHVYNLEPGKEFNRVLWSHDETQWEHQPGLGPWIKRASEEAIQIVAERYGYRGKLRTDTKTGPSWASTH